MPTAIRPPSISVEVLGPLRLVVDGTPVEVPGPRRRAVLALLALGEGRTVGVDDLLDAVWAGDPPDAARAALHSHISRLRGHLGPAASRLEGVSGGYRLRLEDGELDAQRAREALADARARAEADPAAAAARLGEVQGLWRGRPLAELADILPIAARSVALDELRRQIDDLAVECAIAAGDAAGVVGAASEAVAEDPLREPAVRLLMQALAATGRAVDALRVAYDHRRRLQAEAGLDPSPALVELERTIAGAAGPSALPRPGAVPAPVTTLVGRDGEVAALQRLLAGERVVTVVGPAGTGKTRLAVDVARRHDQATFLALAPVTDPAAIPHALAAALDLDMVAGPPLGACLALLAAGPRLLVVDNCEHLVAAAADLVATIVGSCPAVTILATSRRPLGLDVERPLRLGPLPLPDAQGGDPARAPAVAVFVDRARRVRPGYVPGAEDLALIAGIVRRLEGIPLAIELAAGRLASLGLPDLHARLDRSLDLLAGRGASAGHHRSLRATLEWSYDLLGPGEQRLFRHLAVFPDGVDLATAEAVADELDLPGDPDLPGDSAAAVAGLVDASMLDADLEGGTRYRMLDTVRSFGLDRLEATGELEAATARLLAWAVALARWIDAALHTEEEPAVNARLRRELPNLRAAWGLARHHDLDAAVELLVALDDAATWRDLAEVWEWARELGEDPAVAAHPRAGAALAAAADCAWMQGDLDGADRLARKALAAATDDDGRWRARLAAAAVHLSRAEYRTAAARALEAADLAPRNAHATLMAALAAAYAGDLARAEELAGRNHPAIGRTWRAEQAYVAAEIASIAGRAAEAEAQYRHSIDLAGEVGATFVVGIASLGLLTVHVETGRFEEALHGYRDLIGYWERAGNGIQLWTTLRNLAVLLRALGDEERGLFLEAAADQAAGAAEVGEPAWQSPLRRRGPALPDATSSAVRARAATATRAEALDVARRAIDAHLGRLTS